LKFYKDVLCLPTKTKSPDWVEFFNKETALALLPIKKTENSGTKDMKVGTGTLVGFMVSDLDSTANILKENKVRFFKEHRNESFGKHAIIEDPDGHLISIAEIKSKPSEEFDLLGLLERLLFLGGPTTKYIVEFLYDCSTNFDPSGQKRIKLLCESCFWCAKYLFVQKFPQNVKNTKIFPDIFY
jgi:lactoylglutathione lyase